MSREEDLIVRDMLTHNVSMEMVCVCGESLSGSDVDHQGTVRGFADEALALGWRPDGSDVLCPACAEGSAS